MWYYNWQKKTKIFLLFVYLHWPQDITNKITYINSNNVYNCTYSIYVNVGVGCALKCAKIRVGHPTKEKLTEPQPTHAFINQPTNTRQPTPNNHEQHQPPTATPDNLLVQSALDNRHPTNNINTTTLTSQQTTSNNWQIIKKHKKIL